MAQNSGDIQADNEVIDRVKEPGMFHVILINDNYTPMNFVVEILMKIFNKSEKDAYVLMTKVHEKGSAIAGTYIEDVALTKSEVTSTIAKKNGFPLATKVKPA